MKSSPSKLDHQHIQECFDLALKAYGDTSPNPLVGCVIVKGNKVIARGYHRGSGYAHAERDAIANACESVQGATLYCNLEPCCHTNKKTPPCAQFLIEKKIKKVVISNLDPNPEVAGKGVELLRSNGIEVVTDVLSDKGFRLNEIFFYHIVHKKPFVHLKWAQTLDGKMATLTGDSKWITSEKAREDVHRQRWGYDAIAVGANTVINDSPKLTARVQDKEKVLKRIIFTDKLLDPSLSVFQDAYSSHTLTAGPLKELDIEFHSLDELLNKLYATGITSLFVEGGSQVINLFLKHQCFQRLSVYIAPKLLGEGLSPLHEKNTLMEAALQLSHGQWYPIGEDMCYCFPKRF